MHLLSSLLISRLLLSATALEPGMSPSSDAGVISDGGISDAPALSQDAGVVQVVSATSLEGGSLPQGWWLSDPKMQALGAHLVQLTNERDALQAQINQSESSLVGYVRAALVGVAVGCAGGAVGAIYLDRRLAR